MEEIWEDIKGYEGLYQVSNLGRVRSLDRVVVYTNGRTQFYKGRILAQTKINSGYFTVALGRNGRYLVHRLVAEAFIPNPDNLPCINHIDCNKINNTSSNLEFCTYSYNNNYGNHKQLQREGHLNNLKDNKRTKPVIQYSLNNDYINTFLSARRAAEELNICHSGIIRCCCGKLKTCGGYIWRYKERAA